MTSLKMLPVGIENFKEIRRDGFYYVDKTNLIKELLESRGKANLFTRPRRFGKSLTMSMFQSFFEIGCDKKHFSILILRVLPKRLGRVKRFTLPQFSNSSAMNIVLST